jgi:ABC-type transport system substrate-binding protein/class 3 adenylate cyclase
MAAVAGERRIVTVLFADIVGSTAIGELLGPERTKLLIDEVMRVMSGQIARFEGTVAQYVGDELYAVFGVPLSFEDDSERAVRAGLAIQRALTQYAEEVRAAYGVELAVRIAINTGPVVIRPDSEDPYNALGDTVNVAARIQKLVSGGEIVVGRSTKLQVDGCFALEPLGEQDLRGFADPLETFRVVGVLDRTPGPAPFPLVGRDFELSVLDRTLEGLVEGRGAIVSILGEPGIGKSRLVAEVRARYGDRMRFLEGRAVSYARTIPYWPIRELMREWLGLGATAPEARVRLELKAELAGLFGPDADAAYPVLATLLGITLETDAAERIRELSREALRRQTFEVFHELLGRLAADASICVVLEDLNWADEATLELLQEVLPVTEEAAVGLLLVYRSEREHGSWRLGERARQRYPHRYREIELRPLPDDASRAFAAMVAGADLPESVAEILTVRAGGNPYFLEEALQDLVERGALRRENGRMVLTVDATELSVPSLVQGALQARLDRLDAETRELVNAAAVIGRTFDLPLLEQVLPVGHVVPALSELQRLELVVERRRRPVPEYSFRHGLMQEVAYASLVEAKRRKLHLKVGEALEASNRDSHEVYGVLARHFSEADAPEKAAEYLLKAGDAALALYADDEAVEHYIHARTFLARLGDETRARETLFKIALARHLSFDFTGAEDAYDEAFCCRVDEAPPPEPTERLETAMTRSPYLVPGDVYSTEGLALAELVFRGLLSVDQHLTVVPDMADNFRVSGDGLTYLFRLREDTFWSDGVRLTAADFVYAWERMREERRHTAFLLTDIASAEALDDRTLEVRMREPRNYFPYLVASWAYPWPRHKCEELGEAWREPENIVCNGPFMISEVSDECVELVANPYWNGQRGNVREIRIDARPTGSESSVDRWEQGRYDVLQAFQARALELSENTIAKSVPHLSTHYLGFRADRSPFCNELVRRAFAHAVDRAILGGAVFDLSRTATQGGVLPPAMPGHSPRAGAEYAPSTAAELLAEAGFPGGRGLPEIELVLPGWVSHPEVFVDQWSAIGADVRVRYGGSPLCESDIRDGGHIWMTGWTADFPDPEGMFLGLYARDDWPLYEDDELTELLDRARRSRDRRERMRFYHEFDRTWVRERAALVPLAYGRSVLLRRPWVDSVGLSPLMRMSLHHAIVTSPA